MYINRKQKSGIILFALCLLFLTDVLLSGTTGKIAGKIVDKNSGEPLVGVNIVVLGTTLGAATDQNGEYFILQVPPGNYDVRSSMIGYQIIVKQNIHVSTDLTTYVNFALMKSVLDLGEEISIVAERPMVQKDITASVRIVNSEEIASIPNVQDFNDIILIQPGVIGKSVRGGRARETLYMVDGVPIDNPVQGGYSGIDIPVEAIAELQMITGGFNAEYGQAQSGIVNIITKDGTPEYSGNLLWRSDKTGIKNSDRNSDYASFNISSPEPLSSFFLKKIGVDIPGDIYFFLSSNIDFTDTYIPNGETRTTFHVLGIPFDGRQDNRYSLNGKLTYRISPNYKLSASYRKSSHRYDPYDHFWKYLPDCTLDYTDNDRHWLLSWVHTLSVKTFYTLNVSNLWHGHSRKVNDLIPPDYPRQHEQVGDTNHDSFADKGIAQVWSEEEMQSWTLKFDLSSQIHSRHLIKTGLTWSYYNLYATDISYPGHYFAGRDTIPGKWPEYGAIRIAYNVYPNSGAAYLQDKMEFEGLIVNVGLRYDFWMPGEQIAENEYRQAWEDRTNLTSKIRKVKGHVSPRLGISYPITDATVMYFAYGRFTQMPSLLHVYRDAYVGSYVGNPYSLDSEVSSAYEIGFNHQIAKNFAFELKGYLKDVSGLIGLQRAGHFGLPVLMYVNKDYGTIRGFEFQIKKQYSNYVMGTLNYTLAWAKGRSSYPDQESSLLSVVPLPLRLRDFRLDWDQRHTINLDFHIRAEKNMHLNLFGVNLPDR